MSSDIPGALQRDLGRIVAPDRVLSGSLVDHLGDASRTRGIIGSAAAIVQPKTAAEVAQVLSFCYGRGIPLVVRGGGTGFAGGAVADDGSVVLSMERMDRVRALDPLEWRMSVEAGVRTGVARRLARENGLYLPPDPGAAEQSQIGGNIATNAGGPHAFKYGVFGNWVLGLEVVLPPGEIVTLGGAVRKDVAGLDVKRLIIGSEGTLAIVTAAWLRLIPAPEASLPVLAGFADAQAGCDAIAAVLGSGLQLAALDYIDERALRATGGGLPGASVDGAFVLIAEADGTVGEARALRDELVSTLTGLAEVMHAPTEASDVRELWRWRDGVSGAVTGELGHKLSEDVAVPVDRLSEVIAATRALGEQHGVPACSWGHAGDGNVHASFLFAPGDGDAEERAKRAAVELVAVAVDLGGTLSGEHGIGITKLGHMARHVPEASLALQRRLKYAFDPAGLLNPGKAIA
jgi:glycolate oxidase subunit GlcD